MTQQERQERSRQKILSAAMREFAAQEYDNVTIDCICTNHHISKGMIYHYYSSKDELFLVCVRDTFEKLKHFIEENSSRPDGQNIMDTIKQFFQLREQFLIRYPQCRRIFETAVFHPPKHLTEQIARLHEPITGLNQMYLKAVVTQMPLRKGVNPDSVIRFLEGTEFLLRSAGYRRPLCSEPDRMGGALEEILGMFLFGILRQPPDPAEHAPVKSMQQE